jgi:hypothetical protein
MAQIRYVSSGPVLLHGGSGETAFTVTNAGTVAVTLALRFGTFSDDASQIALLPPKVAFSGENGAPPPPYLLPGGTARLNAIISGLSGSSVAGARIFNGDAEIGRLQAVDADAPFDIDISGSGGTDQKLVLTSGDSAVLTIRNNDSEAYPVDWDFQMNGKSVQSGELQLAPRGSSRIELLPTDDLYSWTDAIRPSSRTGTLLLSLHGPAQVAKELLPQRMLRVNLQMQKVSPAETSFWSHLLVVVLLLIGGLLSLIANFVLPGVLRKAALRRQIDEFRGRVDGVSARVSSFLRALLKLEWSLADLQLRRMQAFSFSAADSLDQVAATLDRLERRLKVTARLDELRRRLDEVSMSAPPSAVDAIDGKLQAAANNLSTLALTEEDVSAAARLLDAADVALTALSDTDSLAQEIAASFRELKVRQKTIPPAYYNDLKAALPGLFEMMNQPFDDAKNITRPMMFPVDYGIAALQLAFDYSLLQANAPAVASDSASGQSVRERLDSHQKELIGLMGTLSWPALRELRTVVQEMRENIYEQDVLDEIANAGQAEIVRDPRSVRPFVPALFSVRFKDPRFNDAASLKRLGCRWDFPGDLKEQDWQTCHFFQGNELKHGEGRNVEVTVRIESRKPPDDGKASSSPLKNTLRTAVEILRPERGSYSRALADGLRFLIAMGVALVALLAGALTQLEKLDFVPAMIAVVAIGFGADTVKNLLLQTARKASS